MFKCENPNIIESDEGFSVKVLGPTGIEYKENDRCVRVSSEVLAHPHGIVLYKSSIQKWSDPENKQITDDEKSELISNITRAFLYRNIEVEVI